MSTYRFRRTWHIWMVSPHACRKLQVPSSILRNSWVTLRLAQNNRLLPMRRVIQKNYLKKPVNWLTSTTLGNRNQENWQLFWKALIMLRIQRYFSCVRLRTSVSTFLWWSNPFPFSSLWGGSFSVDYFYDNTRIKEKCTIFLQTMQLKSSHSYTNYNQSSNLQKDCTVYTCPFLLSQICKENGA